MMPPTKTQAHDRQRLAATKPRAKATTVRESMTATIVKLESVMGDLPRLRRCVGLEGRQPRHQLALKCPTAASLQPRFDRPVSDRRGAAASDIQAVPKAELALPEARLVWRPDAHRRQGDFAKDHGVGRHRVSAMRHESGAHRQIRGRSTIRSPPATSVACSWPDR